MNIVLVPTGEVVWLLGLVLCAVAVGCVVGGVASVIVVCGLFLASVGVVSSRIVNITRL